MPLLYCSKASVTWMPQDTGPRAYSSALSLSACVSALPAASVQLPPCTLPNSLSPKRVYDLIALQVPGRKGFGFCPGTQVSQTPYGAHLPSTAS